MWVRTRTLRLQRRDGPVRCAESRASEAPLFINAGRIPRILRSGLRSARDPRPRPVVERGAVASLLLESEHGLVRQPRVPRGGSLQLDSALEDGRPETRRGTRKRGAAEEDPRRERCRERHARRTQGRSTGPSSGTPHATAPRGGRACRCPTPTPPSADALPAEERPGPLSSVRPCRRVAVPSSGPQDASVEKFASRLPTFDGGRRSRFVSLPPVSGC